MIGIENMNKQDFSKEVKILLDQIDEKIVTLAQSIKSVGSKQKDESKISELNKLKIQEYKLKEIFENLPEINEAQWLKEKNSYTETYKKINEMLE